MAVQPTSHPRLAFPFVTPLKAAPTIANIVFRSIRTALAVLILCAFAQWFVYEKLLGDHHLHIVTPVLAALIAGGMNFRLLMVKRTRILALQERFQAIAEAHHHIRNALQSISYQRYFANDKEAEDRLNQAVLRIQWVLDEIFPRFETDKSHGITNGGGSEWIQRE